MKSLWYTFRKEIFIAAIPRLIKVITSFIIPILVGVIINFIEKPEERSIGYDLLYVFILIIVSLIGSLCLNRNNYLSMVTSCHIRSSLLMLAYEHGLKLNILSKQSESSGKIINIMSNDISKIQETSTLIHFAWVSPLTLIVCFGFVWYRLGIISAISGYAVLLIFGPLSYWIAKQLQKKRKEYMKITDERVKKSTEIFQLIKMLKYYALEKHFAQSAQKSRDREVHLIRNYLIWRGIQKCLNFGLVPLMSMATLVSFVARGGSLSPSIAFMIISLYNVLRWPFNLFNIVLASMIEAHISLQRIDSFMKLREYKSYDDDNNLVILEEEEEYDENSMKKPLIQIENGYFSWCDEGESTLNNINIKVQNPQLICVIGTVGSGKSSLIQAILGEIMKIKGDIHVDGIISYVSQTPFLINGTVKDNICFFQPYDEEKYQKVIELCCLQQDLDILIEGDETIIGERGINLSGGQKARIEMARAVYKQSDIVLLDDPLSAVDAGVSKKLFEECIKGYLKNRIVILVTHQLQYIKEADRIWVMDNGCIIFDGNYESLIKDKHDLTKYVSKTKENRNEEKIEVIDEDIKKDENIDKQSNQIKEEKREFGKVSYSTYSFYLKHYMLYWLIFGIVSILHKSIDVSINIYLAKWSQRNDKSNQTKSFITIYTLATFAVVIFLFLRELILSAVCSITSRKIFKIMIQRLIRGTMAFFDTTPKGRIITRLTSDISSIDTEIAALYSLFTENILQVVGAIITIAISVKWLSLIFFPMPICYALIYFRFIHPYREFTRIFSTSKAPILSQINETIHGVQTIRAYKLHDKFIQLMSQNIDINQRIHMLMFAVSRWLFVRNDLVSITVIAILSLIAIFTRHHFGAGMIGVALTYSLSSTELMSGLVRSFGDIESKMNAVERIKQYSEIDIERDYHILSNKPSSNWPKYGEIIFENVSLRYRQGLPLVLKDVNVKIKPNEKVGIVGRTGSGKSTLMSAIYTFTPIETGKIYIDGINIHEIGIHDLRQKISIVPQDPIVFDGTIRRNLDPEGKHNDSDLWNILRKVHLFDKVSQLDQQLDTLMVDEGSNFSVGQRQLLCVGRALLRNSKIILIDEASSNIDYETDQLLQKTIREELKSKTVVTIAHRLQTIIDYDRIIVMKDGKIIESGPPIELYNKDGYFRKMCQDANVKPL